MKALVNLDINLESKAVVELLISKLLPGALVERTSEPNVKHRVIGYNMEEGKGYAIITTDDADFFGWGFFSPGDSVIIQGYEEVRKVYASLRAITVSDDLADYIEEQVATMEPRALDPMGSIFNLNDPRVVEALGTLLVGVHAEVGTTGYRGVVTEVNGSEAKLSTAEPMSLTQSEAKLATAEPLSLTQSDPGEEETDTDADDELFTFNIGELKVFKSY